MSNAMPDLSALSPGTRTDLEILLLQGSVVEEGQGCLVVRSPQQPGFHWGNCLHVTTGDVDDAEHWTALFAREFPHAEWLAIGLPGMPRSEPWQALGLEPEGEDVLTRHGQPQERPLPEGFSARVFTSQADWDQLFEADARERAADVGVASDAYLVYSREREQKRQQLVERGRLAWFGAFDAQGSLASSLGIAVLGDDRRLARYQSVLTEPQHRGKGLAGHLLGVAAGWAAARGAEDFVIVTESANPAGRLYRSVGFTLDRSCVSVYRAPRE